MLQPWEDPSKEVLVVSKCRQHPTFLQESSAILKVLHLPTELESKVPTKLEMMLDETEPMKFHEILHFENLLKSDVRFESQCDISPQMDILQKKVFLLQKLVATLHSLFDSKTPTLPYTEIPVALDPWMP